MLKNLKDNLAENKGTLLVLIFLMLTAGFCTLLFQVTLSLPNVDKIATYNPAESTILYSIKGEEVVRIHDEENREVVPLSKISPYLIECVLAVEDAKFFQHRGVDFLGILRAIVANLRRGKLAQGGSTITQQLARSLFLTRKKNIVRKFAEALLAIEIERKYTKEEILELYLNNVYWGHNAYGAESAAKLYFGKSAKDLTLAEAALLTGLLEGPEIYSPYRNPSVAKKKQAYVLQRLIDTRRIPENTAQTAYYENLKFPRSRLARFGHVAPYFVNHVLKYLVAKYGEEKVYRGGLKVYTTLDLEAQNAAEEIITKIVSREGRTFRFSQAALVALDPRTGYIKTMVGGIDYEESKFNRVIQARRQPGSSFKPFIYTAAMEAGLSPGTLVLDTASTWETTISRWTPRGRWRPYNFDRKFHGPVTIRYAIEFSLNIPAIKVLDKVSPAKAIDVARRMGIKSPLEQSLALALGVSDVSLLEMTSAFGVFANAGIRVEPACIIKVVDRQGNILEQNQIQGKKVLNPNIAAVMVDMLKGVLTRGTGFKGRLEREAAAKTGTTNNYKDAWFIGFVPQLVCGVWVGNDNNTPMRGVAEVSVCPRIWQAFMKAALQDLPPQSFTRPLGLVSVQICLDSEQLATDKCPKNRIKTMEYWKAKVPTSPCPIHTETEDPELIELNKTINEPPEGYLIR